MMMMMSGSIGKQLSDGKCVGKSCSHLNRNSKTKVKSINKMMYFYPSTWGILIAKNWGKLISSYTRPSRVFAFGNREQY
jgi:hypothetical protein